MSHLVIGVIAIILFGLASLSGMYHGGDVVQKSSATSGANTIVGHAMQISGANNMFFLENQAFGTVADLTVGGEYLASAPNPGNLEGNDADNGYVVDTATGTITLDVAAASVCESINKLAGVDVSAGIPVAADAETQFSCYDNAGVLTFAYK